MKIIGTNETRTPPARATWLQKSEPLYVMTNRVGDINALDIIVTTRHTRNARDGDKNFLYGLKLTKMTFSSRFTLYESHKISLNQPMNQLVLEAAILSTVKRLASFDKRLKS